MNKNIEQDLEIALQFATSHLESVEGVQLLLVAAVPTEDGDLETRTIISVCGPAIARTLIAHLNDQVVNFIAKRYPQEEEPEHDPA
jgi:hypothetical protein